MYASSAESQWSYRGEPRVASRGVIRGRLCLPPAAPWGCFGCPRGRSLPCSQGTVIFERSSCADSALRAPHVDNLRLAARRVGLCWSRAARLDVRGGARGSRIDGGGVE